MKQVIDNFSSGSDSYAAYRPQSPQAIFDFLYSKVQNFNTAWDCGTGNGQVAIRLAERFDKVYGTDISAQQLQLAQQRDNIFYLQERAESTTLPDRSIDLITIAQAIHWFDFDAFYKEVKRVATADGFIAAWTYNVIRLTPAVNEVIDHLYWDITRPYWDPERDHVDSGYASVPFPFYEVQAPEIFIDTEWTLPQLTGYLGTWSGLKNYIAKTGQDPLAMVAEALQKAWGEAAQLQVHFPVNVRAGYVHH